MICSLFTSAMWKFMQNKPFFPPQIASYKNLQKLQWVKSCNHSVPSNY